MLNALNVFCVTLKLILCIFRIHLVEIHAVKCRICNFASLSADYLELHIKEVHKSGKKKKKIHSRNVSDTAINKSSNKDSTNSEAQVQDKENDPDDKTDEGFAYAPYAQDHPDLENTDVEAEGNANECPQISVDHDHVTRNPNRKKKIGLNGRRKTKFVAVDDSYIPSEIKDRLSGKTCTECNYSNSYMVATIRHIREIHLKTDLYQCNKCDFGHTKLRMLRDHFNKMHADAANVEKEPFNSLKKKLGTIELLPAEPEEVDGEEADDDDQAITAEVLKERQKKFRGYLRKRFVNNLAKLPFKRHLSSGKLSSKPKSVQDTPLGQIPKKGCKRKLAYESHVLIDNNKNDANKATPNQQDVLLGRGKRIKRPKILDNIEESPKTQEARTQKKSDPSKNTSTESMISPSTTNANSSDSTIQTLDEVLELENQQSPQNEAQPEVEVSQTSFEQRLNNVEKQNLEDDRDGATSSASNNILEIDAMSQSLDQNDTQSGADQNDFTPSSKPKKTRRKSSIKGNLREYYKKVNVWKRSKDGNGNSLWQMKPIIKEFVNCKKCPNNKPWKSTILKEIEQHMLAHSKSHKHDEQIDVTTEPQITTNVPEKVESQPTENANVENSNLAEQENVAEDDKNCNGKNVPFDIDKDKKVESEYEKEPPIKFDLYLSDSSQSDYEMMKSLPTTPNATGIDFSLSDSDDEISKSLPNSPITNDEPKESSSKGEEEDDSEVSSLIKVVTSANGKKSNYVLIPIITPCYPCEICAPKVSWKTSVKREFEKHMADHHDENTDRIKEIEIDDDDEPDDNENGDRKEDTCDDEPANGEELPAQENSSDPTSESNDSISNDSPKEAGNRKQDAVDKIPSHWFNVLIEKNNCILCA